MVSRRDEGDAQLADQQGEAVTNLAANQKFSARPNDRGGCLDLPLRGNELHLGRDITRRLNMRTRTVLRAAILLTIASGWEPAHALTQEELVAKIQAAGYSQVSDIKSTAEGTTAKAMKNGKEVRLVVDSSGQIKERN